MINANLVSVVIPSYNYSAYISDAINSIKAQTYPHWEIIVVDDGSKDNTAEVVARYTAQDNRIKYHYQQNQGLSAARNTGISLAQGAYIQLLDADDYISKRKLEIQVGLLEQQPDVALVYADTYIYTHSDDLTVPRNFRQFHLTMPPISAQGVNLAMHMALDNIFLVGSPLFRRSMAVAAGPFDKTLFSLEDWHFWYRAVLQNQKFVYDNREGTEFYVRTHGNNMTGNRYKMWKYKIQARQALILLMEGVVQSGAGMGPVLRPVLARQKAYLYEEQARYNLLYENLGAGIVNHFRYLVHGDKPLRIWYDSAYWLKERLLGRNRKTA
ncbi:Glycosyltransferase involved in cell wall bisynthesis [Hymenobacter gelipurpurascens]|uniref:Glycosyltransferase involved in cell wall bisynthesis n=1 Tax=Hymenobacter gelipurpurascens TaxID=89968 RepID=A0A212TPF4_9BACT|nr:glycosyltransferase family 2 protein [Hymenobacter gelipurpurascens]SNC67736.1 Glycosyltransferase involved in cell wall bisynthesis [Hymenobacter gelipurpurascens]